MTDHADWDATTHTQVKLEDDYNKIRAHGLFSSPAYIVRKISSYYEAIKGDTKVVSYGGEDDAGGTGGTVFEDVIEAAITAAAGGHIHIADGDYTLLDDIDVGQANTWITGTGLGTKITQGTVDKNGFKISNKASCRISNLWLYGTGAGTGCGIVATTTPHYLTIDHCRVENWGYHGIQLDGTVSFPRILNNHITANKRYGLNLDAVGYGQISGNIIEYNTRHGIYLVDSISNRITDNTIYSNDNGNTATYDGVHLNISAATCDYNIITDNSIQDNDRYEVNVASASCTGNVIAPNNFTTTSDHEAIAADVGTATVVRTHTMPFTGGTTLLTADAAAWGYEIDLANEFALAVGNLPADLHQVLRWKVHAQSIVLEVHGMELLIEGQGGSDNAAFNAQAVQVASEGSVTQNFAANDWIYWLATPADDTDIDDFVAGDHLQVKVSYAAADGNNCATDATFTCVVIEYV